MAGELELHVGGTRLKPQGWRDAVTIIGIGLLAAAIVKELRLPREQRTWHGMLLGLVPYDLRPPTVRRFAQTLWNPEQRAVIVPTAFGVGWSVNVAALIHATGASG